MSNLLELEEATNKNTAIAQGIELMRLAAIANEEVELSDFTDFIHYLAMIATENAGNLEKIKERAFKEARESKANDKKAVRA